MQSLGVDARISPEKSLGILSPFEVEQLLTSTHSNQYNLFRRCALAVLNCGNEEDDIRKVNDLYANFDIKIIQQCRGIKLELKNAPSSAFVDGAIIQGIKEHLFSVLRDVVYISDNLPRAIQTSTGGAATTDLVFRVLRNAGTLHYGENPNLVVCWGGHSISRVEYEYTKEVGYQLGLRALNIGTGCGPGAMKGPMKGATIAHAKQHISLGRYIGLTEPDIIAAEPPNPIVNELVILPDIEKRLEAFVRVGHGIIVFPGGVGTLEEILYVLGILLNPANKDIPFPVVFTGPKSSADYFVKIDEFIGKTLGKEAQERYEIIIDDPQKVAQTLRAEVDEVADYRRENKDAYYFNWLLNIDPMFQTPFIPTHENMSQLKLHYDQQSHELACHLRRAFSGVVAGNVKETGIIEIEKKGPYIISGDKKIMGFLDDLLRSFVEQKRMKLGDRDYKPCYQVVA